MADNENLFRRLTRLFRTGPAVSSKVKSYKTFPKGTAFDTFKRARSGIYSHAMSAYGSYDRAARYGDFSEMEYMPEIASALDIYAEESTSPDESGRVLHIHSENPKIKEHLDELFYDILNVDFNLAQWVRTMCKYGDFFLFNDVDPNYGVINAYPIPVNEIEREEGFDPDEPMAVRFRWLTQGNQVLENWQMSHFRLLGNDAFLPYGSSVLEPARRIWRQLILIEDAMLVYRVIRSPERRVFYIDVGNVPPEEVANYMEQAKSSLKRSQVVDKSTGRVDLRYNPLSVDEDYFIPVRGSESGTKIDSLSGGANQNDINDVEYVQKKLFAALKIPKAYLGYDESLSSKATLAQEDIRFSRSIAKIQRTVLSELNKLAIVNLYVKGYDGEDLLDFKLSLSNPSTIAQQQKLELWGSRFDISSRIPEGMVDRRWIRKTLLNLTDAEIEEIEKGRESDKLRELELETIKLPQKGDIGGDDPLGGGFDPGGSPGGGLFGGEGGADLFGGGGGDTPEAPDTGGDAGGGEAPPAPDLETAGIGDRGPTINEDEDEESSEELMLNIVGEPLPVKKRKSYSPVGGHIDFSPNTKSYKSGVNDLKNIGKLKYFTDGVEREKEDKLFEFDKYLDKKIEQNAQMTAGIRSTLKSLNKSNTRKFRKSSSLLNEADNLDSKE